MNRIGKWYRVKTDSDSFIYIYDTYKGNWLAISFNGDNNTIYLNDIWKENMFTQLNVAEVGDVFYRKAIKALFTWTWKINREYG